MFPFFRCLWFWSPLYFNTYHLNNGIILIPSLFILQRAPTTRAWSWAALGEVARFAGHLSRWASTWGNAIFWSRYQRTVSRTGNNYTVNIWFITGFWFFGVWFSNGKGIQKLDTGGSGFSIFGIFWSRYWANIWNLDHSVTCFSGISQIAAITIWKRNHSMIRHILAIWVPYSSIGLGFFNPMLRPFPC